MKKKRKIGFILNIATICLSLATIAIGVYSLRNANLNLSGSVGFKAHECEVMLYGTMEGGITITTNGTTETIAEHTSSLGSATEYHKISSANTTAQNTWDFGTVYFDDYNNTDTSKVAKDITITLKMYNVSDYKVVATYDSSFIVDSSNKITATASKTKISMPANQSASDADNQTMTITLTLTDGSANIDPITCGNLLQFKKAGTEIDILEVPEFMFEVIEGTKNVAIAANMTIDDNGDSTYNCPDVTNFNIPEKVVLSDGNTYTVTSIPAGAFYLTGDNPMTSIVTGITIPSTIEKIEAGAFMMVPLDVINIDSKNTHFKIENNTLIDIDNKTILLGGAGAKISNDVTTIANNAFNGVNFDFSSMMSGGGYKGLTTWNLEIPANIVSIGDSAFMYSYLTSLTLSCSPTKYGETPFTYCFMEELCVNSQEIVNTFVDGNEVGSGLITGIASVTNAKLKIKSDLTLPESTLLADRTHFSEPVTEDGYNVYTYISN